MSLSQKDRISFIKETMTSESTPQSSANRYSPTKSSPFSSKSPFSFNGTPSSKMFFSHPVSPNAKTFDTLQIVTSLSDVNSPSQVSKALGSVQNVKARIQLVDQIIKKRQEIKDAEDELKLEKAAPVIQKLTVNFKKRLKKAQSNDGKLSFQKTLLSLINEEESPLKPSKEGSKLDVEMRVESRRVSLLVTPNKKEIIPSIKLDPGSHNPSLFDWGIKSSLSEDTVQESQFLSPKKINGTLAQILGPSTMSQKTKTKVELLLRQTATSLMMKPSELPPLENEKKETPEIRKIKITTRSRKSTATSLKEAKQEVEKNLYQYLVNNKESDASAGNILTLGSKVGSMGDIESRAKTKFKHHIELKEKSDNYFVPMSFSTPFSARKSSRNDDDDEEKVPKQKVVNSFRSHNATVRHISYDVFSNSTPKT